MLFRSDSTGAHGFSNNGALKPNEAWLPQSSWWGNYSVESQDKDPGSTLNMYRTALEIRREESGLGDGPMEWVELGGDVLAFSRPGNFLCVVSFSTPVQLPKGETLVASAPIQEMLLPADSAVWMRLKK